MEKTESLAQVLGFKSYGFLSLTAKEPIYMRYMLQIQVYVIV